MKLNVIKKALETSILAADTSTEDRQDMLKALTELQATLERATDSVYGDEVHIVTAHDFTDIMLNNLYETYAKRRKTHGSRFPFEYFQYDAHKIMGFENFTIAQLQIGYDVIGDLWEDNEADGSHDENGLCK